MFSSFSLINNFQPFTSVCNLKYVQIKQEHSSDKSPHMSLSYSVFIKQYHSLFSPSFFTLLRQSNLVYMICTTVLLRHCFKQSINCQIYKIKPQPNPHAIEIKQNCTTFITNKRAQRACVAHIRQMLQTPGWDQGHNFNNIERGCLG